jgi:integrase
VSTDDFQIITTEAGTGPSRGMLATPVAEFDDTHALDRWLAFIQHKNLNTYRSYRKEANRFRMFLEATYQNDAVRSQAHLMRDASEKDVQNYQDQLKGFSIDRTYRPLRIPSTILRRYGWKEQPFVMEDDTDGIAEDRPRALKNSSINLALSVLHALYDYWREPDPLTKVPYVMANPVRRLKASTNRVQRQTDRNFPPEALQAMMQTLARRADALVAEADDAARNQGLMRVARQRWIVALLFGLWGRRAEIAGLTMDKFRHDGKRWTVELHRKGGHDEVIPVAPWVMQELTRYRQALGKPPLPNPAIDKGVPAIAKLREREGRSTAIADDLIYREVQAIGADAAAALRAHEVMTDLDPVDREMIAARLESVTPHWFRHAGASMAINTGAMSLETASKMLGHSSVAITSAMYFHADDQAMEDGMQRLGSQAFGMG